MRLKSYKIIEGKTKVIGIGYDEFKALAIVTFALLSLPTFAESLGYMISMYYYLVIVIVVVALYFTLRWGSKKNYPGFINSMISYYYRQPKRITTKYVYKKEERH